MALNREELTECMSCVQENKELTTDEEKNRKVFEHIKYRDTVMVHGSSDDCHLTYRQIATF